MIQLAHHQRQEVESGSIHPPTGNLFSSLEQLPEGMSQMRLINCWGMGLPEVCAVPPYQPKALQKKMVSDLSNTCQTGTPFPTFRKSSVSHTARTLTCSAIDMFLLAPAASRVAFFVGSMYFLHQVPCRAHQVQPKDTPTVRVSFNVYPFYQQSCSTGTC
jgi:hypothetical protein